MTVDVTHEKRALRAELRERRRNLTVTEREHASERITANLIDLVSASGARSIACYLSAPDEPNTRPFLGWAESGGIRVLFPISRADGLLDWAIGDGHTETQGLFGMPEPVGQLVGPIAINDVDLIIVPAAAVDRRGMRMGWGRGYFDKTLGSMERCPPVYAVVYDSELIDSVPSEVHDQAVDGVVTPTAVTTF